MSSTRRSLGKESVGEGWRRCWEQVLVPCASLVSVWSISTEEHGKHARLSKHTMLHAMVEVLARLNRGSLFQIALAPFVCLARFGCVLFLSRPV